MTLGDESDLLLKMLCHDLEMAAHLVAIGRPRPFEFVFREERRPRPLELVFREERRPRPLELLFREERRPRPLELLFREERRPRPFELVFSEDRAQARLDLLKPAVDAFEPCFDPIHKGESVRAPSSSVKPATTTLPSSMNRVKNFLRAHSVGRSAGSPVTHGLCQPRALASNNELTHRVQFARLSTVRRSAQFAINDQHERVAGPPCDTTTAVQG